MAMIVQAIETRYFGPTNARGARVKATAGAGSVTVTWDHAKKFEENHIAAAKALAEKFGWAGTWYGGGLPKRGFAFVLGALDPDNTAAAFVTKVMA